MGRGAWWATVRSVAKSGARLKRLTLSHFHLGDGCRDKCGNVPIFALQHETLRRLETKSPIF